MQRGTSRTRSDSDAKKRREQKADYSDGFEIIIVKERAEQNSGTR